MQLSDGLPKGETMDDIIVRVLRAVACRTRLRIMWRLAAGKELTPSQLARELRLRRALVSAHLARLESTGLILRRRSGARCYCTGGSPYSKAAFSGQVAAWVYGLLKAPGQGSDRANRAPGSARVPTSVQEQCQRLVFDAATAFTDLRRLQILRRLADGKAADALGLGRELRMSHDAATRHISKLVRRGYVCVSRSGQGVVCQMAAKARTPAHARLLDIVAASWAREASHS